MQTNWFGVIFVLMGGFSVAAAALDWEWFMNHRKALVFMKLFGRTGTRVFYTILGLALVSIGIAGLLGWIDMSKAR